MEKKRKGQYFVVKPFALIMTIIVMFVLFYFLQTFRYSTVKDAISLDTTVDTTNVLSILTNSEDCIAYNPLELGLYGSIVAVDKLDKFQKRYTQVEPECARNYVTGWNAEVEDLMSGKTWTFGAPSYSRQIASRVVGLRKVSSMPIAIRYSATKVNPGRIQVEMFSGDLEKLAGFIDYVCMAGKRSYAQFSDKRIYHIDYPISVRDNIMCLTLGKDNVCRELYCDTVFEGIPVAGEYRIVATYMYTTDKVVVNI